MASASSSAAQDVQLSAGAGEPGAAAVVDIPDGVMLLPLGTKIELYSLHGNAVDSELTGLLAEVISKSCDDTEYLEQEWIDAFIRTVRVPTDCISFCMEASPGDALCGHSCLQPAD